MGVEGRIGVAEAGISNKPSALDLMGGEEAAGGPSLRAGSKMQEWLFFREGNL